MEHRVPKQCATFCVFGSIASFITFAIALGKYGPTNFSVLIGAAISVMLGVVLGLLASLTIRRPNLFVPKFLAVGILASLCTTIVIILVSIVLFAAPDEIYSVLFEFDEWGRTIPARTTE